MAVGLIDGAEFGVAQRQLNTGDHVIIYSDGVTEAQNGKGGAKAQAAPGTGEFVVRGALVLSMDEAIGDLPVGDVHVRDGAIVAVAASVPAPGADVIDGKGMICMPGFVDTHVHYGDAKKAPDAAANDPAVVEPYPREGGHDVLDHASLVGFSFGGGLAVSYAILHPEQVERLVISGAAINHSDGGRGLYFDDPDGHRLEIITRPYGSGG